VFQGGEGYLVVPGHPVGGGFGDPVGVLCEGDEVVEGVLVLDFAGVDDAHEEVADVGAVFGFEEQ